MKKLILFFVMSSMWSSNSYGADNPLSLRGVLKGHSGSVSSTHFKGESPNITKALSFLVTDGVHFLNHDMIVSLAVNKTLENVLLKTAYVRKKCLSQLIYNIQSRHGVVWHKYGTMAGSFTLFSRCEDYVGHQLTIYRHTLCQGLRMDQQPGWWDWFAGYAIQKQQKSIGVHVDDKGQLYMDVWGNRGSTLSVKKRKLMRYFLWNDGVTTDSCPCPIDSEKFEECGEFSSYESTR